MAATGTSPRLGDRLVEAGLVTTQQLELGLREQRRTGLLLGEVLENLGFVTAAEIATFLAGDSRTPAAPLLEFRPTLELAAAMPETEARRLQCLPFRCDGSWQVAFANPYDCPAIEEVEQLLGASVEVFSAPADQIDDLLNRLYGHERSLQDLVDRLLDAPGHGGVGDTSGPAILQLVEKILIEAIQADASDVHFEPDERVMRVRMRCDGVLQPLILFPHDLAETVVARLKVLANLDLSESRLPQDGRFQLEAARRQLAVRVSSLPTRFGESIVVRLLEEQSGLRRIEDLQMSPRATEHLRQAATSAQGIILVCGPTGSGKTTTLYSILEAIDRSVRSVFTLEDPVEYPLPEIRQSQVNEKAGYTFASGLRALLRQDPDVLLVGETRDPETAQLLSRAALTGHLVLSSLHTQDTFSAVTRLLDLGIEPYLLAPTLRLLVAQRLVRRVCTVCHGVAGDVPCPACGGSGYRGRIGFYEVFPITPACEDAILQNDVARLREIAAADGVETLQQAGMALVQQGITTQAEVLRVSE